ncbi:uncharacterized protein K02A2.6-like [Zerene cesonia]|uniref:uncharacterized protein K02A2.6-like n=1 Tax=Zerene cesonia TaxID=33412 RepID=UPI0018E534D6|nr:uncharacterized protein K02A2.6-like [Zerene cesonia]
MAELKIQPFVNYDVAINFNEFNLTDFSATYGNVFAEGLGRFTGGKVSIHVREGARPVFLRVRPLAFALRERVERALDQLVADGVLSPVERSDWATPIVPIVKKDGNIRICANYKLTLNKVIEVDRYPLPRVKDLLIKLKGGERFSKIDLSQAYAQFELDDSRKYTVINTHKGLFMYNRLVYGLSSRPGIFQRHLEQLFVDIPSVGVFLDDIIITGPCDEEHINNLHKVFGRLQKYGLKVRKDKCVFFSDTVKYLGYIISKNGVHTCPDKVQAIIIILLIIINIVPPTNTTELRSFIGMILTTDASSVGIGAVISHVTEGGERPIAYASRALTAAERDYSQIDREALAIVFRIRKFHQYLYAFNSARLGTRGVFNVVSLKAKKKSAGEEDTKSDIEKGNESQMSEKDKQIIEPGEGSSEPLASTPPKAPSPKRIRKPVKRFMLDS